jgi:alpha/beta superfamily hydrolase
MKEQQISFPSQSLTLEGLFAPAKSGAAPGAAVVCHPHPQYGGSMYNNVVEAALEALWDKGFATLRFNFRGVGESEGSYGGGAGEAQDAVSAINHMRARPGLENAPIVLIGYSFGAAAAWQAAPQAGELKALVLIAAPLRMMDTESAPQIGTILLIGGSEDSYCPAAQLEQLCAKLGAGASFKVVEGADHFFGGYEADVTAALRDSLAGMPGRS